MRAKDRKQFTEAWNQHIMQLGQLAAAAGPGPAREFQGWEGPMREWAKIAGEKSFPEPTAAGELPGQS